MRRLALIGLAAAGAAAALACGAAWAEGPRGDRDFRPIDGVVVGPDWAFLMDTGVRQVFIQVAPKAGENPTAFLRYEERENQGAADEPMYSMRTAFEFDCDDGLFRSLRSEFYAGQNLTRPYPTVASVPKTWVEPAPSSIALAAFYRVCDARTG